MVHSADLPKVFDSTARDYRVRYAIRTILRDRIANDGLFRNCFEMEDADDVMVTILRRGLRNRKLRAALRASHLINFTDWLGLHPEFFERYYRIDDYNSVPEDAE